MRILQNRIGRIVWFSLLSLAMVPLASTAQEEQAAGEATSWREQYAHAVGAVAYVYTFPYLYLANVRWASNQEPRPGELAANMPINHFYHVHKLIDATYKEGGRPNNDTLYSLAYVDVSKEPIILSVPPTGDRYFTFQMAGFDSDNFAYVGQRATGNQGGNYAIMYQGWEGELPEGVEPISQPAHTPWVYLLGRTYVAGPEDLPEVHAIQAQYKLTPLSLWGKEGIELPERRDALTPDEPRRNPVAETKDPLADWRTINRMLTENPPPARDAALVKLFAGVNIGPGQDVDALDDDSKRGLARALRDGRRLLQAVNKEGGSAKEVNGWMYYPNLGRLGTNGDYLNRAAIQSLSGLVANDPEEAVYVDNIQDSEGQLLTGDNRYHLYFPPGREPEARAFWSLTLYGSDFNLVDNPIDRYSIGDRTPGLQRDQDGGLMLYIQHESPGEDKASNWLPTPPPGEAFSMILRAYIPGDGLIQQTWEPPAVTKVE